MAHQLSEGSLKLIMNEKQKIVDDPVMQILGLKKIQSSSSHDRYRILLSDGLNSISFAMIKIQANSGAIENYSVIKLKKYLTAVINNAAIGAKKVLLILEKEMVVDGRKIGKKIGDPEPLDDKTLSSSNGNSSSNSSRVKNTPASPPNRENYSVSENKLISPISAITPIDYHGSVIIKARVTSKSNIGTWSNSHGECKFFSVVLMDKSGEIRCNAFRDLVYKFYDYIQVNKVYYISKCQVRPAKFNSPKNHYEMIIINETVIKECTNDVDVPQVKYNFVTIDQISNMEMDTSIDVIGVCKSASDLQTIVSRSTNRELKKRKVQLVDPSNTAIDLTLEGSQAEAFDSTNNPVVVIKKAKVGEFEGGINIAARVSSQLKVNPDIPECHKIKGWYSNEGWKVDAKNVSERPVPLKKDRSITINQIHQLSAGSLRIIMDDQKFEEPVIMQVLNTEKMYHHNFLDRELYLIGLSDGVSCTSFGLYNPLPSNSGGIEAYSVIRLKQYLTTVVTFEYPTGNKDRKVLLIVDRELVVKGSGTGNKTIGDPKSIDEKNYNENSNLLIKFQN